MKQSVVTVIIKSLRILTTLLHYIQLTHEQQKIVNHLLSEVEEA